MDQQACPADADLAAFNLGELSESRLEVLASHVETCPSCEERLRMLDRVSDGVITLLRGFSPIQAVALLPAGSNVALTQVDEYEILGELGRGGWGVVFRARHQHLGREVALKMLLGGQLAGTMGLERFQAEARAVAQLRHPNIVQLFDVGNYRGQPYFTMELVEGGSLASRVQGQPQLPERAALWVATLARAIHHAHDHRLVHRDLKPSNILVTASEELKICDFGVAKHLEGMDPRTVSGQLVGTPEYMAPEQASGQAQAAGPAADVYSLGAILYALLTGRPPFQGATALATLEQVRLHDPVSPTRLQAGVPRDLATICLKCLEKDPRKRYAAAAALADDLDRFLAGRTILARPASTLERGWKWALRRPALAALLTLACLVAFGGTPLLTWLLLRAEQARGEAEHARHQTEQALYASYIRLAQAALQNDDVTEAAAWLDQCRTLLGAESLRGWEYEFLRRQCTAEAVPMRSHLEWPDHWLFAAAYYSDGRLLSGSGPVYDVAENYQRDPQRNFGLLKLWDAQARRSAQAVAEQRGGIRAVAVSSDSRWVASGCTQGQVALREGTTLTARYQFPLPEGVMVYRMAFAPGSHRLAVATSRSLHLGDIPEGPIWASDVPGHIGQAYLAFRPDGAELTAAFRYWHSSGHLKVVETATGREQPHALAGKHFCGVGYTLEGCTLAGSGFRTIPLGIPHWRRLAISTFDNDPRVQVWDVKTGQQLEGHWRHNGPVTCAAVHPRGWLATAGDDRAVRLWDLASGTQRSVYHGHHQGITSLEFAPDGHRLSSGGKDGTVRVWDLTRDPRYTRLHPFPGRGGEWIGNLAFTADSAAVRVVGEATTGFFARTFDPENGTLQGECPLDLSPGNPNRRLVFSADGRRVAAADQNSTTGRQVKVWDSTNGRVLATVQTRELPATSPALSGDGNVLAYAGRRGANQGSPAAAELHVHDLAADRLLCSPAVPARLLSAPGLSRDGQRVAAVATADEADSSTQADLLVWDTATGTVRYRLPVPQDCSGPVTAPVFSPDGRRLAIAGPTNEVALWVLQGPNHQRASLVHSLLGPGGATTGLAFSPNSQRLAAAGQDGRVRLWEATAGHEFLTLKSAGHPGTGHYGFAARLAFSPDGRFLAANDWDGTVTIWDTLPSPAHQVNGQSTSHERTRQE